MTREKIGEAIYKERRKKKWSYYKLWKQSGIVAHQIKSIEQASSDYTFCTLLKVLNALELNVFK